MKFDNKLEYIVYDNKETFALIDKNTGYRNYNNKYKFFSCLEKLLNLTDEELNNLEIYIGPLKYILPISRKPYNKEIKQLNKAKKYINKMILNPFYSNYEIFKLACELKYFKEVTSKQFHDLSFLTIEQGKNIPNNYFERVEYIYKCCQKQKVKMVTAYELKDFEDFIVASLTELLKNKKNIKKCENCGRYFLAKRSDAKYCDYPSPQNKNKTCKEYAPAVNYEDNLDEATRLYRKIYKTLNQDKLRNPYGEHIKRFEKFKEETKQWKQTIKNGNRTKEEFFEWLKQEDKRKY